jgi:chromosome segregation ATPase
MSTDKLIQWLPVIIAAILGSPGIGALLIIVLRNRSEKRKIESEATKSEADAANTLQDALSHSGERMDRLEDLRTQMNTRLGELTIQVAELKTKIIVLEADKTRLEEFRIIQNSEITTLQTKNQKLEARVRKLEALLTSNNIVVPVNGD